MTIDFLSRMIGTVIFALIGARVGVDSAPTLGLPTDITAAIFSKPRSNASWRPFSTRRNARSYSPFFRWQRAFHALTERVRVEAPAGHQAPTITLRPLGKDALAPGETVKATIDVPQTGGTGGWHKWWWLILLILLVLVILVWLLR